MKILAYGLLFFLLFGNVVGFLPDPIAVFNYIKDDVSTKTQMVTSGAILDPDKAMAIAKMKCCNREGTRMGFPDTVPDAEAYPEPPHTGLSHNCQLSPGSLDRNKGWLGSDLDDPLRTLHHECNCGKYVIKWDDAKQKHVYDDDYFNPDKNQYAVNWYGACIECPWNAKPRRAGGPAVFVAAQTLGNLEPDYQYNKFSACLCTDHSSGTRVGYNQYDNVCCDDKEYWHEAGSDSKCVRCEGGSTVHEEGKSCECEGEGASYDYTDKKCYCDDGQSIYYGNECAECPTGSTYNRETNSCVCPNNRMYNRLYNICCEEGEFLYNGRCRTCPGGSTRTYDSKVCACPTQGETFHINSWTCQCEFQYNAWSTPKAGVYMGTGGSVQCVQKKVCRSQHGLYYNPNKNTCCRYVDQLILQGECQTCPIGSRAVFNLNNGTRSIPQTCQCQPVNAIDGGYVDRVYKKNLPSGVAGTWGKCLKCPEGDWGKATQNLRRYYHDCKCPNGWLFSQTMPPKDSDYTGNCYCPLIGHILNGPDSNGITHCVKCPEGGKTASGVVTIGSKPSADRSTCECENGFRYDFGLNKCVCDGQRSVIAGGICVACPYGQTLVRGTCACPSHLVGEAYIFDSETKTCVCERNYVFDSETKTCVCDPLSRIDEDIFLYEHFFETTYDDGRTETQKMCKEISFETLFAVKDVLYENTDLCPGIIDNLE